MLAMLMPAASGNWNATVLYTH